MGLGGSFFEVNFMITTNILQTLSVQFNQLFPGRHIGGQERPGEPRRAQEGPGGPRRARDTREEVRAKQAHAGGGPARDNRMVVAGPPPACGSCDVMCKVRESLQNAVNISKIRPYQSVK